MSGFDWEEILGAEGGDIYDAYENNISDDYWNDDDQEEDYWDSSEIHEVKGGNNMENTNLIENINKGDFMKKTINSNEALLQYSDGRQVIVELPSTGNIYQSSDYERIADAKIGDYIELYINGERLHLRLLNKGDSIITNFTNIRKGHQIPFNNGKINYKFYYDPRKKYTEGTISSKILNGLKKFPDEIEYENEYKSLNSCFLSMLNTTHIDMLCCIPGHIAKNENKNSIARMIQEISCGIEMGGYNGSQVLKRIKDAPESKGVSGSDREKQFFQIHLDTIRVTEDVEKRNILLIDDITTSGTSMMACRQLLLEAGASSVTCFAFARAHSKWKIENVLVNQNSMEDEFLPF